MTTGHIPSFVSDDDIDFIFRFSDTRSLKYLNPTGVHRSLNALGWRSLDRSTVSDMMEQLGKDPVNGLVDIKEFRGLVRSHMFSSDSKEDVDAAFNYFDPTGTGFITLDALRSVGTSVTRQPVPEQVLRTMLRVFDTNKDGVWDLQEFRAAVAPALYPPRAKSPPQSPVEAQTKPLSRRNSKSRESSSELNATRRRSLSKEGSTTNNSTNSARTTPRHSVERISSWSTIGGIQRVGGVTATASGAANTPTTTAARSGNVTTTMVQSNSQSRASSGRLSNSTRSTPRTLETGAANASPVTSTNITTSTTAAPAPVKQTPALADDYCPIFYVGGAEFELDAAQGTRASLASVRASLRSLGYFTGPTGEEDFMGFFQSLDKKQERSLAQEQLFVLMSGLGAL